MTKGPMQNQMLLLQWFYKKMRQTKGEKFVMDYIKRMQDEFMRKYGTS